MSLSKEEARALDHDPLAGEEILEGFYRPTEARRRPPALVARQARAKEKPTHYKIVCISLYNEDLQHLEHIVTELKRRGHTKANRSQVIRAAIDQLDLAKIPKGY